MSHRWGGFITESIENELFVALIGEYSDFLSQIIENIPSVVPGLEVKYIKLDDLSAALDATSHLDSLIWVVKPHEELRSTLEVYKDQVSAIQSLVGSEKLLVRVVLPQKHEQDVKEILRELPSAVVVVEELPEKNELAVQKDLIILLNNIFGVQERGMIQYASLARQIQTEGGLKNETSSAEMLAAEVVSPIFIPPRPAPISIGYQQPSLETNSVKTYLFSHLPEERVVRSMYAHQPQPSPQLPDQKFAPHAQSDLSVEYRGGGQAADVEKVLPKPQSLPPELNHQPSATRSHPKSSFTQGRDIGMEAFAEISEREKEQEKRLAQLFVSPKDEEEKFTNQHSNLNEADSFRSSSDTESEESDTNPLTDSSSGGFFSRIIHKTRVVISGFSHDLPIQVRLLLLSALFVTGVIGGYVAVQATATAQIRTIVSAFTDEYSSSSSFNPDSNYDSASVLLIRAYEKLLVFITPVYGWIGDPLALTGILRDIEVTRVFLSTLDEQQEMKRNTTIAYASVLGREQQDPLDQIAQVRLQVEAYLRTLGQTSSLIRDQGASGVLGMYSPADLDRELSTARVDLLKAQYFLDILPEILGKTQKKTYAVLIQNPLEIRSSGGFLESIVFLTFDKGYLLDVQVQDVTILDSQLRGRVEPPQDLRRVLGEESWYLRDANWNPSFPAIARQTSWFVEKQLGRSIDGVIAINTHTLRELIRVLGPVEIGDEVLTPENLFERLFAKSELLLATNDSNEKKGFVSQITQDIITKLQTEQREEAISSALQVIFRSLITGQSMISTNNTEIERALLLLSMNGEVYQPQCPQVFAEKYCVVETIYHLDSNVGVNRANHFVSRDVQHEISVGAAGADHTYIVRYVNTAPNSVWPSGAYKNYMRLVLPEFSQIGSVSINGRVVQPEDYLIESVGDKRSVGWLVEVPVGDSAEVTVRYRSAFVPGREFAYALFRQHQAGIVDHQTNTTIRPAPEMRVVKVAPAARVSAGSIEFEQLKPEHIFYAVELQEM